MQGTGCLAQNKRRYALLNHRFGASSDKTGLRAGMSRPLSNIFLLIVLFVGSMSKAVAQSLTSSEGPANLPPADFTGTQFVDNKGCVYIRTGRKGATSWTPRVSRDRKLVCGFKPSFTGTSAVPLRQKPAIVAQNRFPLRSALYR